MEAILRLYALLMLPAALAFIAGALIYLTIPDEPLLAAMLGPVIGVGVVALGMVLGVDQWAMATVRRRWPWSDTE